jgi:glycosyltransferase involved in cell wall biosynthesis
MRIVIVTNALIGGGAENSMRMINQKLRLSGMDSTLVCLNASEESKTSEGEIQLSRRWKSGAFQTILNYIHFFRKIRALKPESILANCELPELYVAFIPIKFKQITCVEHTSKPWAGRKVMGYVVRRILLIRKSNWVTVNSSQKYIWPCGTDAIYIPNPVKIPTLATISNAPREFVFVGRLRPEKGITAILDAISDEKKSIDVFGSGNLEKELKEVYSNVASFHGFVDEPWKFISPEQVLVVASEYEGDGRVIVEGILARVPILLLDNIDLRRFELPDRNYFSGADDLRTKLNDCLLHKEDYRPSIERMKELRAERDVNSVVDTWAKSLS